MVRLLEERHLCSLPWTVANFWADRVPEVWFTQS